MKPAAIHSYNSSAGLRMYLHPGAGQTRLSLEGDLTGGWVRELERCWRALSGPDPGEFLFVDVSQLDSADQNGYRLLGAMRSQGVHISGLDRESGLLPQRAGKAARLRNWLTALWDSVTRGHRVHVLTISRLR
jgi:hypothetical protein